jgi:hypothetical protein
LVGDDGCLATINTLAWRLTQVTVSTHCHVLTTCSLFILGHFINHLSFIGLVMRFCSPTITMGSVRWAGGQAERPVWLDFPFVSKFMCHSVDYAFSTLFDLRTSRLVFVRFMCGSHYLSLIRCVHWLKYSHAEVVYED